jgi:predicted RNA-binding Zn ribbon-like protein
VHTFRSGAGRISLDFIRTLRHRGRGGETEELPDPAALGAWVAQLSPVAGVVRPDEEMVRRARKVREAAYCVIAAGVGENLGTAELDRARQVLNREARQAPPFPHLSADGALTWRADDPVGATLQLIAQDAMTLITQADQSRIKRCANPECATLFLDTSRPGSRRWCSMNTCGNQAKKGRLGG